MAAHTAAGPGPAVPAPALLDAVLFDLDGTLIHSAPGILESFKYAFWQFGVVMNEDQLRPFMGPPLRQSFAGVLAPEEVERAVRLYRDYYAIHGQEGCCVFPGVPQMLAALRKAGCTLCIATSKAREVALQVLAHYGLLDAFDYVGGASMDASLDTKTAVLAHVLARPGLQGKQAVMVGDRDNDMQGAADCALPAVAAAWGYAAPGELEAWHPAYLAPDVPALQAWLLARCIGGKRAT